jgi:hypothetical protein
MFFPAADTIAFTEGGTESMRIDSSGNVGIGTSSPSEKLNVVNGNIRASNSSNTASTILSINNDTSTNGVVVQKWGTAATDTLFGLSRADLSTIWSENADNFAIGTLGAGPLVLGTNNAERMRITSDGNLLFGTTATNLYGNFANAKASATLSASETSGQTQFQNFSRVQTSTPVASSTVESFRFLRADGTVIGANRIIGHVYVYADAIGGGNSFIGIYTIISHGNGTSDATLTLVRSTTRGVSPVSSISLADDGAGGGVKINITYTNLGGAGVAARTTVSFVGQV